MRWGFGILLFSSEFWCVSALLLGVLLLSVFSLVGVVVILLLLLLLELLELELLLLFVLSFVRLEDPNWGCGVSEKKGGLLGHGTAEVNVWRDFSFTDGVFRVCVFDFKEDCVIVVLVEMFPCEEEIMFSVSGDCVTGDSDGTALRSDDANLLSDSK